MFYFGALLVGMCAAFLGAADLGIGGEDGGHELAHHAVGTGVATSNIYVFYFGALLVGMCAAFFSSAITITLLNKWFAKGQATLLAVSMTVGALGGTVGSPIVGGLIGSIGYAATLRYIAIGMVAVTVVIRLLLRKDPAQLG